MTKSEIRLAARCLRNEARALKEAHTVGARWFGEAGDEWTQAHADWDTYLDLARKLERLAKKMK